MTVRAEQLSPVKQEAYRRLRARAGGPRDPLVPLREGGGTTGLVLVHPVGGALLCYVPLLQRLPADTAVVGFAMEEADEQPPADGRIARLARRYLTALAARPGPPGHWLYAGWSFGGTVAYEMSRLTGPGSAAVLIDSDPHGRDGPDEPAEPNGSGRPDEATVRWWFVDDLARLAGVPRSTVDAVRAARRPADPVAALLDRLGLQLELTEAELADRYRVFAANTQALAAYRPGRADAAVTWVRSPRPAGAPDPWRPYCPGLRVREVPGTDHYTLLAADAVDTVAQAVIEALATHPATR